MVLRAWGPTVEGVIALHKEDTKSRLTVTQLDSKLMIKQNWLMYMMYHVMVHHKHFAFDM